MKTTVVTSFSPAGYELYGRRFMQAFDRYFSDSVELVVYTEGGARYILEPWQRGWIGRDLWLLPNFRGFHERHAGSALANGREPAPGWKIKDLEDGYSYRFDAVKFCRKVFAIADASSRIRDGLLVWLDADSYAHEPVPEDLFSQLIGDADVAYLGRDGTHSECGFLAFRIPAAVPLIIQWENLYRKDTCFQEREWHDSYLFDRARLMSPQTVCRNLTPGGRRHVWMASPLAAFMDHLKGDRKQMGFSPERRNVAT